IKKIEAGKEPKEPATTMRLCDRCKETRPVTYTEIGGRSAYRCAACSAALTAEVAATRAALRAELAQLAGDWIATTPEPVLRLRATAVDKNARIGLPQYAQGEQKAAAIRRADSVLLRELLLDIIESAAYAWRGVDLSYHGAADDVRAVGAEGSME